jgi:hypothetical protein
MRPPPLAAHTHTRPYAHVTDKSAFASAFGLDRGWPTWMHMATVLQKV